MSRESARKVGSFVRRKKRIYQTYNYTCQVCGYCINEEIANFEEYEKPKFIDLKEYYKARSVLLSKIQIHHILPLSNGGKNNQNNLLLLCKSCHEEIHNLESQFEDSAILRCFDCSKLFPRKKINLKRSKDTYFNEVKNDYFEIIYKKTNKIVGYAIFNFTKRKID